MSAAPSPPTRQAVTVVVISTIAATPMREKLVASLQRRGVSTVSQELSQFNQSSPRVRADTAVFIDAGQWIDRAGALPPQVLQYFSSEEVRQSYVFSSKLVTKRAASPRKRPAPIMKKAAAKKK